MSKTALSAKVVRLRPTTVLTTRKSSKQGKRRGDKRAYLTEAEVERLIKAAETLRDKAMILIGYRHGLRVSELVTLRWRQIDLDGARIQIERLKDSDVNLGLDTLSLAAYLGHKQVQNTKRYAKMNATRFDGLWKD